MKNFITILVFLCSIYTLAQQTLDTIYANDTKNVALFFPEPIRQGITGSDNFIFTYNREKEQYFGLLQAKPGAHSNLLVIDKKGGIFSYILAYKKELNQLNHFIYTSNAIGIETPMGSDALNCEASNKEMDDTKYYDRFCNYLLQKYQQIGRIKTRAHGILLNVENIVFDRDELYFVIRIQNNSSLDYDFDFLRLYVETRQKGKRKSSQRLYKAPIYAYGLPSDIKKHDYARLVFVMPKFSLSKDRRIILELNEKQGERNLVVRVSHRFVNHPN